MIYRLDIWIRQQNILSTRQKAMDLCNNCKTGSKNAYEILNKMVKKGTPNPELEFFHIFRVGLTLAKA